MIKRLTTEQFINKANTVHNNKYDYNKVIYIKNSIKIIINCKIHSNFEQTPLNHLAGNGCPQCANLIRNNKIVLNTDIFIEKAKILHKNYYSYNKSVYKNAHVNIIVTCPKHGNFNSTPSNHLYGLKGCKKCGHENHGGHYGSVAKKNPDFELYLYHLELKDKNGFIFYKIGLSKDVNKRITKLNGLKVKILETQYGKIKDLYPLEQEYHKIIKEFNIQYMPKELRKNYTGGYTECYKW